ncbi:MAG TPA: NAD(P)-binding domain-containing protein, partial [Vicinamibacterales bacterium]|nr:NAD(P)-binding domain-containing protein [Vicinamibacterales bacterium]
MNGQLARCESPVAGTTEELPVFRRTSCPALDGPQQSDRSPSGPAGAGHYGQLKSALTSSSTDRCRGRDTCDRGTVVKATAASARGEQRMTIGFIGAGHIGSQLARLAVAHGHDVVISNSRGPATLSGLVAELGPRARAGTPDDAARAGDMVVVTIPLKNYRSVPVAPLAGKVVIDTNNYYPERDGHIAELDNESTTTAELLQSHLPSSKVVKAFNHIPAPALTTEGQPAGTPGRRAI